MLIVNAKYRLPNNIHFQIYFADDDNAYSLDLFEELRKLKTIAMFPVGLIRLAHIEETLAV